MPGLAETANLVVRLNLQDNLSAPVDAAMNNVAVSATKADVSVQGLHTSFRQFGRIGSETRVVALAAGDAFGVMGGEAIRLASDVGLVVTGMAELGPAAVKGASGILATQAAAAAAKVEMQGLAGATLSYLAAAGPLIILAAAGAAAVNELSQGQERGQEATAKLAAGTGNLYDKLGAMHQAAQAAIPPLVDLSKDMFDLSGHVDESTHSLEGFSYQLTQDAGNLQSMGNDVNALGKSFDNSLNPALLNTGTNVSDLTERVNRLGLALIDLPQEIPINIVVNTLFAKGAGAASIGIAAGVAGNIDTLPGASGNLPGANSLTTFQNAADAAARKAKQAADEAQRKADEAARKAKQRAEELARAYDEKVSKAFKNAQNIGSTLFDSLHAKNVRAIKDAETLAQKNHDTAVQAISDNLKVQLQKNAAPVSAAEAAQAAIENARQLRDLQENLQAAQQSGDAKAIRDAAEALQSFQANQRINDLKAEQAKLDAKAQHDADQATQKADADLAAAQRQELIDLAKEDKADRQKQAEFTRALVALQKADKGKPLSVLNADITALESKFGITTDAAGFHHIGSDISDAIRSIKITVPAVEVHPTFAPKFFVNAREIAVAVAAEQNPTQSTSVRTAQSLRR